MQTLGFRRPNQVREAVYRHLKDLLLSGRFSPGERLSEPLLAQELGVSRTPVREALMRLAEEGLVELVPGKGARVRVFAPEEVEEVWATLYRTGEENPLAEALIAAARKGKRVHVLLEGRARFDELLNLRWYLRLVRAGVEVLPLP